MRDLQAAAMTARGALSAVLKSAIAFGVVGLLVLGVLAYFIGSYDPNTHIEYDGLGRQLVPTPLFVRWLFGEERRYPGLMWFFADMAVFWGAIGVGGLLIRAINALDNPPAKGDANEST